MTEQTQTANVAASTSPTTPSTTTSSNRGGSLISADASSIQTEVNESIANQKAQGSHVPNDQAWLYDEGISGKGDRPDYLVPKFKSVADQAKSYKELEKKLGSFKGAPEQYDFKFVDNVSKETGFKLEPEHPDMKEFLDFAKKSNASQEVVENILTKYAQMQVRNLPNPHEELKKLGDQAPVVQKRLEQWFANKLTKEEYALIRNSVTTADMALVLDKLRSSSSVNPVQPPSSPSASPSVLPTSPADVQLEIESNWGRYQKDRKYREETLAKLKQAVENSEA